MQSVVYRLATLKADKKQTDENEFAQLIESANFCKDNADEILASINAPEMAVA